MSIAEDGSDGKNSAEQNTNGEGTLHDSLRAGRNKFIDSLASADNDGLDDDYDMNEVASKDIAARVSGAAKAEAITAEARKEKNMIRRAVILAKMGAADFPDTKFNQRSGVNECESTESNRYAVFDAQFGTVDCRNGEFPHWDEFTRRFGGWGNGDKALKATLVKVAQAYKLKGQTGKLMEEAFESWRGQFKRNSLIDHIDAVMPQLGPDRFMEEFLIKVAECDDTPLNRQASRYLFLSLYNRATSPGCEAPVVLNHIGFQGCGKSYMSECIARLITGEKDAAPTKLDLSGDLNKFLTYIIGSAPIAIMSERVGFNKADVSKSKDFITTLVDKYDDKYEKAASVPRQFIIVADANTDVGLYRDNTGERRQYPIFWGQLPDKDGKKQWKKSFKSMSFDNMYSSGLKFAYVFWQIMAECREWIEQNGQEGYVRMVTKFREDVAAYSEVQLESGSGTTYDPLLDLWLDDAVAKSPKSAKVPRRSRVDGSKSEPYVFVAKKDIVAQFRKLSGKDPHFEHMIRRLEGKGAIAGAGPQNVAGFMWMGLTDISQVEDRMRGIERDAEGNVINNHDSEYETTQESPPEFV